jgi:hypothetical protein
MVNLGRATCASQITIAVLTVQTVISEVAADLTAFLKRKTVRRLLGLCPTNPESGGKILEPANPCGVP